MTYQLLIELSAAGSTVRTTGPAGTSNLDLDQLGGSPRIAEAITAVGQANPEDTGHALSELTSVLRSVLAAAQPLMGGPPQAVEVNYPAEWTSLSVGLLSNAVNHAGMPSNTKITPAGRTVMAPTLDAATTGVIDPLDTTAAPAADHAALATTSLFQTQPIDDATVALAGFSPSNSGGVASAYSQLSAKGRSRGKLLAGALAIVAIGAVAIGGRYLLDEEGSLLPFGSASNVEVEQVKAEDEATPTDESDDSTPPENDDTEPASDTETTTSVSRSETTQTGSTPSTTGAGHTSTTTTASVPPTTSPQTTTHPSTETTTVVSPSTGTTPPTIKPIDPGLIAKPTIATVTLLPTTLTIDPKFQISTLQPTVTLDPAITIGPVITR